MLKKFLICSFLMVGFSLNIQADEAPKPSHATESHHLACKKCKKHKKRLAMHQESLASQLTLLACKDCQ